jgi:hypothetical protein
MDEVKNYNTTVEGEKRRKKSKLVLGNDASK